MAYITPYLSSSEVNSGTAMSLNGVEISHAHQNNLNAPEVPTKITTSDVVGTVDFLGWENAVVKISGVFNGIDTTSNVPNVNLLKLFAKETSGVYLYDPIFYTAATQIAIQKLNMSRKVADGISTDSTVKGAIVYYGIDAILTE